ncbi:hypothetical protein D3C87_1718840 [compost metagenome]
MDKRLRITVLVTDNRAADADFHERAVALQSNGFQRRQNRPVLQLPQSGFLLLLGRSRHQVWRLIRHIVRAPAIQFFESPVRTDNPSVHVHSMNGI